MTALVKVLERDGMVERRADPSDGRVALVALTTAGAGIRAHTATSERIPSVRTTEVDKLSDEDAAALGSGGPGSRASPSAERRDHRALQGLKGRLGQ